MGQGLHEQRATTAPQNARDLAADKWELGVMENADAEHQVEGASPISEVLGGHDGRMNDRSLDLSDALDRNVEGMNRRAPTRVFRGGPALATAEVQDGLAFEGPDLGEVRAPHLVEPSVVPPREAGRAAFPDHRRRARLSCVSRASSLFVQKPR